MFAPRKSCCPSSLAAGSRQFGVPHLWLSGVPHRLFSCQWTKWWIICVVPTGNKITRITPFSTQTTVTMIFSADATLLNFFFLGSVMWHYFSSCCLDWGSEWWMQVFPHWQHMTGSLYLQCCVGAKDQWWLLSLSLHVDLSAFMAANK